MIIEKHKTIFVHIPKNAGTSIKIFFGMKGPKDMLPLSQHDTIKDIKEKIPNKYKEYKKFTIVRNPYSRMISWFFYLKKKTNPTNFITGEVNKEQLEFKKNVDFKQWVKSDFKYFNVYSRDLLMPQYNWVDETVTVLKFENLKEELEKFFKYKINIPHNNATNHEKYINYYDQESLDIVYDKYKKDFEKFNYKKI